jgi:hypothetical protein
MLSKKLNLKLDSARNGKINRTLMANAKTIIPDNLSGTERGIA